MKGKTTGYTIEESWFDSCQRRNFSLAQNVQTASGANSGFCLVGNGGTFCGGKAGERETNHTPPSSAEVRNE
jgi:hypothetical protein